MSAGVPSSGAQQNLPTWSAVEELKIDGVKEDFSEINRIGVSPNGTIVIEQPQDGRLLFFSATGKRIGSFGRRGEGPGEFHYPATLGWNGDTLWVNDVMLHRTTFVSPRLKHIRDVSDPSPGTATLDAPHCLERTANGAISNPFCARTVRGAAPDSSLMVIVSQDNPKSSRAVYTVTATRPGGAKVFSRVFTTTSVPVQRRWVDSVASLWARGRPDAEAFYRRTMPAYFQPVATAYVGDDGSVWLLFLWSPGSMTRRYLVLSPTGDPLATLTLPKSIAPAIVIRNTMWAVLTAPDGVDSVVRYHIQ